VLELGLRLIDFVKMRNSPLEMNTAAGDNVFKFYEYDSLLGWKNKPGEEGIFTTPDKKIDVKNNLQGLRDIEHSYGHAEKPRVLVLGDSFVWGYNVESNERFTDQLQRLLGKSAEIINAGVCGYGTDQELLYYRTEGFKYMPDLVVLTFGAFDAMHDNMQSVAYTYPKPYFELAENGLVLQNVPVPERTGYEWTEKETLERKYNKAARKDSLNKRLRKYLRRKFKTYGFISDGIKSVRRSFMDMLKSNKSILKYMMEKKSKKKPQHFFVVTKEIVKELKRTVEADNARLVVLMVTYRSDLSKLPSSIYGKMIEFCQEEDIMCIDPYEALFKEYKKGRGLYFKRDEHWNAAGHKIVSEVLRDALEGIF